MKVVITLPVNERQRQVFAAKGKGAELVYLPGKEVSSAVLADVDAIIGNVDPGLLRTAPKLRWVQLNSAGADKYCHPGVISSRVVLTNATGAYGLALSEHMLAQLLAMMKKLYRYYDNQKQCLWQDEGPVTSIYGATVVVVGLGDIGGQFAQRVKALGAKVIGIKRRLTPPPAYVDKLYTMEDWLEQLPQGDIVAASLPGTAETYHLFDKKAFRLMKQGAYFLNIGRGSSVVTEALCEAVSSKHLAGAAVDVTDPEPLPADHSLWQVPNLYVTPHIAGQFHLAATLDNIVRIAADNLEAFLADKPLRNEVDLHTGYKK